MTDPTQHLAPERIRYLLKDEILKGGIHRDNVTPAREVTAANEHLAQCPDCRDALRDAMPDVSTRAVQRLMPAAEDADCLDDDLMARYVQGNVDAFETEIVEMHLEDCSFCAADVADLKALRQKLETRAIEKERSSTLISETVTILNAAVPVAAAVQTSEPAGGQPVIPPVSWRQRLREWFVPAATKPLFPLLTGAAVAACAIYVALVMPIRAELKHEREEQTRKMMAESDQITKMKSEVDLLERQAAEAAKEQAQLVRVQKVLTRTQRELVALKAQQKDLLVREGLKPDNRRNEPPDSGSGVRSVRPEPLPAALEKYLDQPQLALAEGAARLKDVATPHYQTMGANEEQKAVVEPLAPVASIVATQTPQFRWKPVAGATHYNVEVNVPDRSIEFPSTLAVTTTVKKLSRPLSRNVIYRWYVVARDRHDRAIARSKPVKFKVLDAETATTLQRFAGSPQALILLYAKAGMTPDVQRELGKYLRQNPDAKWAQRLQEQMHAGISP
jgi:hypothetical protein